MEEEDRGLPKVGSRFIKDSHKGTVLFVGEVPPTKGLWLGVEWDDAERGKHDGLHDDKRYFTCRYVQALDRKSVV